MTLWNSLKEFWNNRSKKQKIGVYVAIALVVVLILTMAVSAIVDGFRTNLVDNGSFESWLFGKPSGWSIYDYRKDYEYDSANTSYGKDSSQAMNGNSSAYIDSVNNDIRYYQDIEVKSSAYYKITASFKVEGTIESGHGAGLSIYDAKIAFPEAHTLDSNGEWVTYTVYGVTGENQETLQLAVGLGGFGATSTGKIWIDNVSMEQVQAVPEGAAVYNLFAEAAKDDDLHVPILDPDISRVIFVVCVIVTLVFVIALAWRSDKQRKGREDEIAKGEWQPGMKVITSWKEILIIAVLTISYLLLALYNLGDMKSPETYFAPTHETKGEYLHFSFAEETSISRVMYHTNLDHSGAKDGSVYYKIEYLNAEGEYETLMDIKNNGFYKWHYADVDVTAKQFRVLAISDGLILDEIGFLTKDTESGYNDYMLIPVTLDSVEPCETQIEHDLAVSTLEEYGKWFDEQDTIVDTPSFMNSTYFDEIYFPRTAYEHINGLEVYEITHPPLGKVIQAVGILVFGMNPFGWRIMGTLFGVFMIPLMYLIAKKMFNRKFYATMAAALMLFDTMHFAQTRLATIDSYTVVWIMLMYYFMYDVFTGKSYELKARHYFVPLALSGVFFGVGSATKWIGLYAGFGLAIVFFLSKWLEYCNYKKMGRELPDIKEEKWYKNFMYDNIWGTFLFCVGFFVIIPVTIYTLSYIPYTQVEGNTSSLLDIVLGNQTYMYNYHSLLTAGHGYSSEWWSWLLDLRPIWYYQGEVATGLRSTIASFGNPLIWWSGLIALFASCYIGWKKADKKVAFILVAYACQLFPWMIVFRACFIYHYFSCLPFLILFIVYVAKHLVETKAIPKWAVCAFVAVCGIIFVLFYPAISGAVVPESYIAMLRFLPNWWF